MFRGETAEENRTTSAEQTLGSEPAQLNRRRHSRYPCEGQAEVFLPQGGLLLRGRILDLNLSGCFIEAAAISLERGTHVEVHFTTRQLRFRVPGNIAVLHLKRGAGIAFQEMSSRTARQITDLIRELKQASEAGSNGKSGEVQTESPRLSTWTQQF